MNEGETGEPAPAAAAYVGSAPIRSPGVRLRYLVLGGLTGAAIGFAVGVIVLLLLASLRTIGEVTATEAEVFLGIGLVIGLARGAAVSTRLSHDELVITNPWRNYRLRADQVDKIVSIPSGSARRPATLGVLGRSGYVEIPIRALQLPPPASTLAPDSPRARAFADLARWARGHDIAFRVASPAWSALLEEQGRTG